MNKLVDHCSSQYYLVLINIILFKRRKQTFCLSRPTVAQSFCLDREIKCLLSVT